MEESGRSFLRIGPIFAENYQSRELSLSEISKCLVFIFTSIIISAKISPI